VLCIVYMIIAGTLQSSGKINKHHQGPQKNAD